jgi:hypothetical protein
MTGEAKMEPEKDIFEMAKQWVKAKRKGDKEAMAFWRAQIRKEGLSVADTNEFLGEKGWT